MQVITSFGVCFDGKSGCFMSEKGPRLMPALSDPYCQFAWMSDCLCVCLSATLRSNISETKGDRGSIPIGSL